MVAPKITDEQFISEIENGLTLMDISKKYQINYRNILSRKAKLVSRGYSPEHGWNIKVPEGYHIQGNSTCYKIDENGTSTPIIQWVKSSKDQQQQLEDLKEAIQIFVEDLPKVLATSIPDLPNEDLLACYPLGDPHIGMLSWDQETGDSWDLKIAEETFIKMFDSIIKRAPKCKRCKILNLGDYFHTDNTVGVTARSGHHLDCDGRFAKMAQIGIKIFRQMITSALEHHEIVEVDILPGNHDDVGSIFLGIALKHIYENEPRVLVDDSPSVFHYTRFGKNLIGSHHGHTCKMDRLPGVMACDMPKDWGETEFRYWLTGHIHHDSKKDINGCVIESFRTLAAKDVYSYSGGWRSGRDIKVIIYHKEFGEVERYTLGLNHLVTV